MSRIMSQVLHFTPLLVKITNPLIITDYLVIEPLLAPFNTPIHTLSISTPLMSNFVSLDGVLLNQLGWIFFINMDMAFG